MGYRNREIEFKLEARGSKGMASVVKDLAGKLGESRVLIGASVDVYWSLTPFQKKKLKLRGDFIRVRCMENGGGQMTVKEEDKKSYTNRVEIDVATKDPKSACTFLSHVLGNPTGAVNKAYHVFFMEDDHTTVSVYQVKNDGRVFLEVEAKSMRAAAKLLSKVTSLVNANLHPVNKSLFNLVVNGQKPRPLSQIQLPRSVNKFITIKKTKKRKAA